MKIIGGKVIQTVLTLLLFGFVARSSLAGLALAHTSIEESMNNATTIESRGEFFQFKMKKRQGRKGFSQVSFSAPGWLLLAEEIAGRAAAVMAWPIVVTERMWGAVRPSLPWDRDLWISWAVVGLGTAALSWRSVRSRCPKTRDQAWWLVGMAAAPLLAGPVYRSFQPEGDLWPCAHCGKKKLLRIPACQFCGREK